MIIRQLAAGLAVFSSCAATPVFAQSTSDAPSDIVVTASGLEQPRDESGQAITIIDRDRIESLQAVTISDVLALVPGVRIASRGPVGGQTSAFLRGGNSSQTLVLIDGVRVNDLSSPNGAFDFGSLLAGNIGRIEVLRGPNSVIWGSQAIGGVIAIESLAPTDALLVRGSASYGFADTVQSSVNVSGTSGDVDGSIGGGYFRSDGISALRGGSERDGFRNLAANGRLKVRVSDAIGLDFRGYYSDARVEYDDPFGLGADALPVTDNRQFVGHVGATIDLAGGRWRNRIAFSRTDIERVGTDPVLFSFNNFDVRGTVDRFDYHAAVDIVAAVSLFYGLEHERRFTSTSFEGFAADVARDRVTSGFVQAVVRPMAGLTLTGGVRHDEYRDYGGQTTLGGNAAFTPNEGRTVLRVTYGEGFRAPTLTEGQPPFGNPALRPETARNVDIGIEQSALDGRLRAIATWFSRRSTDLIAFSPATGRSENIDRVRSEGVELALALRPVDSLDVQASYTLTDAINRSSGANFGNRLALRPRDIASLTIDWQSPWGAAIGATVQLVGDSFDDAANRVRIDGHALAGVRASFALSEAVELFGRVENLFDARYETVARFGTYGRSASIGVRGRFQ